MELPPEKIGLFYLGGDEKPLAYDARDLTTHAVIVGMTGSGKTGLGIIVLEEAALDRIPAIIIDPKGDMTNLMLIFPDLRPEDFLPWINKEEAVRKGMSEEEYAAYIANKWREGLRKWGITEERLREVKRNTEFVIYTPGSQAGVPINILGGLRAPDVDEETRKGMITNTVLALLELVGIEADPLKSKEFILLSSIFDSFWGKGEDITLEKLIYSIQNPPFKKLGVFDLDTFYPEKERLELAMLLNNLLASPSFSSWIEGEELNVDSLLYTEDGRPKHSIIYLAHLSDRERMFFVSLLLQQVISWMRKQEGTTSLRALLYFDEIYGFMPPVKEPPSKRSLLTLLKQARAFGIGLVLVTQNPVDLDYKGLSNAGTWFIGRLQTERDVERLVQGLKTAGIGYSTKELKDTISSLEKRQFLMHNVHEEGLVTFRTRWAMSYLRGPLTKDQISRLMEGRAVRRRERRKGKERKEIGELSPSPPLIPDVEQVFLPAKVGGEIRYYPAVVGVATVLYSSSRYGIEHEVRRAYLSEGDWEDSEPIEPKFEREPVPGALFAQPPDYANSPKEIRKLERKFKSFLYRTERLRIRVHKKLKVYQQPGEDPKAFFARLMKVARERRDEEIDRIRERYERKLEKLEDRLDRLRLSLREKRAEYEALRNQELLDLGGTLVGYLMGRKPRRRRSSSTRKARLTAKIERLEDEIEEITAEMRELEDELKREIDEIRRKWDGVVDEVEEIEIKPKRGNINVEMVAVAWRPFVVMDGKEIQAY